MIKRIKQKMKDKTRLAIIALIVTNPQVIAICSFLFIILIWKKTIFFLKTLSVIWLTVKHFVYTYPNVLKTTHE